ncbi:Fanconi anemia core complex-associated protein 20 [Myotis myotis]|uniref:FA core complex associated protein 20 n=1 Tax=Myotis myotis TaxID=51298 RepID=A0A7J7QW30_MYOMY|nr:Fanconi anemia core complex-associated protein 20 [Myotis myotis]KAF6268134.1 FA core complex associated protein 20 [Myotis myotis]
MEAPRRPRLRLSRRRLPSGGGPPRPRAGPLEDGERARLWAELVRTASADLGVDGELPPLPAFPAEEPRQDPERAAPPEAFTVGPETFPWTPFPPAPRGGGGPGCAYPLLRWAGGRLGSPAPSRPGCPPPESREVPRVQERPAGDRAQTLQSCPMCQVDFAPGLAQLDIDSHLAQCLADSTEDVAW